MDGFQIIRSRRRSIGLEITSDARLVIRAPHWVATNVIRDIVRRKREWIDQKTREAGNRLCARRPLQALCEGDTLLYLGKEYPVIFKDQLFQPVVFDNAFLILRPFSSYVRTVIQRWYKDEALRFFSQRVAYFCEISGLRSSRLALSNARGRWGSCTSTGSVRLNWRLLMAPAPVIDYVIAHEIAHLSCLDHSRRFWSTVAVLCPGYRGYRSWLRQNGHMLVL